MNDVDYEFGQSCNTVGDQTTRNADEILMAHGK